MKFTKVTTYYCDGIGISFHPVNNVPGFSHKVAIVNGYTTIAKDWLSDDKDHGGVSPKSAAYFWQKHEAKIRAAIAAAE